MPFGLESNGTKSGNFSIKETPMTDDKEVIFTKSIRLRNGNRIFASHYGLEAFRILVRKKPNREAPKAN